MPETPRETNEPERTLAEIIADLTWEDLFADGITTLEEIEVDLRAKGLDPDALDYLYK